MCPVLMAMGMTYDEYWNGDNNAPRMYIRADKLRRKRRNEEMWLQGLYVYRAVHSLSPELNSASKEFKPQPYLDHPIPLTKEEIEAEERRKQEEEADQIAQYLIGQSAIAMAKKKER